MTSDLKKLGEDVRRHKCLVMQTSAAHEISNLRVSPLEAVVTHKVRIINDFSFETQSKEKKEDSTQTQTRTPSPNVYAPKHYPNSSRN